MAGMVRPKGEKGQVAKGKADDPEGAAFDVMRRELVFDAKAKVTSTALFLFFPPLHAVRACCALAQHKAWPCMLCCAVLCPMYTIVAAD